MLVVPKARQATLTANQTIGVVLLKLIAQMRDINLRSIGRDVVLRDLCKAAIAVDIKVKLNLLSLAWLY